MRKIIKCSVIAILALIGLLMVTGCSNGEEQALYGPPATLFDSPTTSGTNK